MLMVALIIRIINYSYYSLSYFWSKTNGVSYLCATSTCSQIVLLKCESAVSSFCLQGVMDVQTTVTDHSEGNL